MKMKDSKVAELVHMYRETEKRLKQGERIKKQILETLELLGVDQSDVIGKIGSNTTDVRTVN